MPSKPPKTAASATPAARQPTDTERFLEALFGDDADRAWVASFTCAPAAPSREPDKLKASKLSAKMWHGGVIGPATRTNKNRRALTDDANQYVANGVYGARLVDGRMQVKRRKAHCERVAAVMVDDIGTGQKVTLDKIKLPLSAMVETSPGNCQGWYILDPKDPDSADAGKVALLIERMVAAGLTKDLTDPGMKGVTRYGRLPAGINNKPGRPPWAVRLRELHPGRVYTVQAIAGAYGLELTPSRPPAKADPSDAPAKSLVARLEAQGLAPTDRGDGKWDMRCPWVDQHTQTVDSGTAYFEPAVANGNVGGFKCHHGHCEQRTIGDLFTWVEEREQAAAIAKLRDKLPKIAGEPAASDGAPVAAVQAFKATDAGALLLTDFPEQVFITSGAIQLAAGAYLLAGKPKHGKSWLAMGLAAATVTGESYVGTTIAQRGQAIYVACDDSSLRRFKHRLQAFKPGGPVAGLTVVTEWSPDAKSSIDVLDALAVAHPQLRFVVIDTLSAFRKAVRSDNPYQQEYGELKALNDWAHSHNVVLLVVHHLRKGKVDPGDPFESISGTLGLQGATDGNMVLARTDDNDSDLGGVDRKLAGLWLRGRDMEGENDLGLELKDGRWHIIGTAGDVFAAGTQRLILQVLRETPGARWCIGTSSATSSW